MQASNLFNHEKKLNREEKGFCLMLLRCCDFLSNYYCAPNPLHFMALICIKFAQPLMIRFIIRYVASTWFPSFVAGRER